MDKMIGQSVFSIAFKRKDKAKTLANISSVKVAPERTIDPGLLFQRFLVVLKLGVLSLEDVMMYELSPFPLALFEVQPKTQHYVQDGGSLLQRLSWKKGETYGSMAQ